MKRKASVPNDQEIIRELRENPQFAAEYLNAAIEDSNEPAVLLMALRHLSEARGGLARVAKQAGIERESLYRALSPKGNPRLSTLTADDDSSVIDTNGRPMTEENYCRA